MSPWKVILATLVIFCSGLVTGALLVKNIRPQKPQRAASGASSTNPPSIWHVQQKEFLKRIEQQLELTPAQREEIEKALRESQERTKSIRDKIAPELREEMKRTREEIRTKLTPDQQAKFDEAMKQLPKSRKEEKGEKGEERRRKESRKEEPSQPAEKPQ